MDKNIEVLRGLVEAVTALDNDPIACAPPVDSLAGKVIASARALAAMAAQAEAQAGGEVDVTGFGTPPLMHDERADAEKLYSLTAFDYAAAPIGSRDWTIYWRGWWHRSLVYGDTTPPPGAVPEGMVLVSREEIETLRDCSDLEMGDGDFAREMASKWLSAADKKKE